MRSPLPETSLAGLVWLRFHSRRCVTTRVYSG